MRLLLLLISASILFIPAVALAQEQDYQVVKSDKSESFVFPYTASNQDKDSPLVYTFETPKQPSWILSIQNNLSYVPSGDSKTIIRINEPAPSEKYIEIAMFGGESRLRGSGEFSGVVFIVSEVMEEVRLRSKSSISAATVASISGRLLSRSSSVHVS